MEDDEGDVLRLSCQIVDLEQELARRHIVTSDNVPSSKMIVSNVYNEIVLSSLFVAAFDQCSQFLL